MTLSRAPRFIRSLQSKMLFLCKQKSKRPHCQIPQCCLLSFAGLVSRVTEFRSQNRWTGARQNIFPALANLRKGRRIEREKKRDTFQNKLDLGYSYSPHFSKRGSTCLPLSITPLVIYESVLNNSLWLFPCAGSHMDDINIP